MSSSPSSSFWNNFASERSSSRGGSSSSYKPLKERLERAASSTTVRSAYLSNVGNISAPSSMPSTSGDHASVSSWNYNSVGNYKVSQSFVSGLTVIEQENYLMYELLYCLTGMRGILIEPVDDLPNSDIYRNFKVNAGIHNSLRETAQQILPLAGYYSLVKRFIDESISNDSGQIRMALAEVLNAMIKDYYLLMARHEKEWKACKLTLRKLHFYLRPTTNIMKVLSDVAYAVKTRDLHGGTILSTLTQHINAHIGNDDAQKVLHEVMEATAKPYMEMLDKWLEKGVINDPYGEFLVEDNEMVSRDNLPEHYSLDYWERRYTLRMDRIPCFLEKSSDVILRTGKYLNCIRQCGSKHQENEEKVEITYTPKNKEYIYEIERAYKLASVNLLDVILYEHDLKGHLQTVKNFFLMEKGDFISQFMDVCESELCKLSSQILPLKLENLLGLTVRLSSAAQDPYNDAIHCHLLSEDLVTQLTKILVKNVDTLISNTKRDMCGLYCFAFKFDVKWPVSLVLNHMAISKYQLIFRQLFFCRHVERELGKLRKIHGIDYRANAFRAAFALRQRMLHAIQNLEYYMLIEVIEPNWHTFEQNIMRVENLDEILACHQDFLDSTLKNCMLTSCLKLNKMIFKLYAVCLKFAYFFQNYNPNEVDEENNKSFEEQVNVKSTEFTDALLQLLNYIRNKAKEQSTDRILNLLHRMNYNEYYTQELDRKSLKDLEDLLNSNDTLHEVAEQFKNFRMTFTNDCNITTSRTLESPANSDGTFESLQSVDSYEFLGRSQWDEFQNLRY